MNELPVLEFRMRRRQDEKEGTYVIDMHYTHLGSVSDVGQSQPVVMKLSVTQLNFQIQNSQVYSQTLSACFFADPLVWDFMDKARISALDKPLRVRLFIDSNAPELQTLHWELLCNPEDGTPLFLGENLYFSRYLESADWRPVRLHPKESLRALAVVSNPSDISDYPKLEKIDVAGEVARAREGLGDIPLTMLGEDKPASLVTVIEYLRVEKPDILYLVCHGAMKGEDSYLWLQTPKGTAAVVSGKEIAQRISELAEPPLLVILASCQSAGFEDAPDVRVALGQRLAQAGVPAVVAMQGNISLQTVADLMPVFFSVLQEDGQVDRAMTLARGHVRGRLDYWMPVLFTRLENATIFAEPRVLKPVEVWNWRALVLLAVMILLGSTAVIGYMAWPRERNIRLEEECQFCVAIAGFQVLGDSSEKNLGRYVASTLSGQLERNLQEIEAGTEKQIGIWGPKDREAGSLKASSLEKLDLAAEELAKDIHADVVVYGQVEVLGEKWKVTPRFYISSDYEFRDLLEVTGQHDLGTPFEVTGTPRSVRRDFLDKRNIQRGKLLASIVVGESLIVTADYDKALQALEAAQKEDITSWQDPAAGKLLYMLMGNAASRIYQSSLQGEMLDRAESYYSEAKKLDPNYARVYLGLSSVCHQRALQTSILSENPADVDTGKLQECIEYLQQAQSRVTTPDLAHVQEKVEYGLGEEYFAQAYFKALVSGNEESFDPAIQQFTKVISAYEGGKDEVRQELAAEAHARLGLIFELVGDFTQAAQQYRQALELNLDQERAGVFQESLDRVEVEKATPTQ